LGLPFAGPWRIGLDTDARRYGGAGGVGRSRLTAEPIPWGTEPASTVITLPALGTLFLRPGD
jgi:1,4-alpha-glucan branching enzyme